MGYINNDTITSICWDGFIADGSDEDIVEGIHYLYEEFSDIKTNSVDFSISW